MKQRLWNSVRSAAGSAERMKRSLADNLHKCRHLLHHLPAMGWKRSVVGLLFRSEGYTKRNSKANRLLAPPGATRRPSEFLEIIGVIISIHRPISATNWLSFSMPPMPRIAAYRMSLIR